MGSAEDEWNGAGAAGSKRGSYSYSVDEYAAGKENCKAEKPKNPHPKKKKKEIVRAETPNNPQPRKPQPRKPQPRKPQPRKPQPKNKKEEILRAETPINPQPNKEEIVRAETSKNPQPKNKKKKKKKKMKEEETVRAETPKKEEETVRAETPKNPQPKKEAEKKPIMSLSEAMAKIDHSSLAAFLAVSLESYSDEPVTQLLRFMDYIGRELTEVQFPWLEMFPFEGTWPKLIDVMNVPLCDIPEPISNTSVSWILQVPVMTLSGFVVWAFGCTITHLEAQQKGAKSGKIGEQPTSPKPHMPIFVTLAMVVHWRPTALTNALSTIRERRYFQGQDRLPLTVWMMAVASQRHLSAGLFSWARNLLPVVGNTSCNHQSADLILQLVEYIVAHPMAWTIRRNQADRLHERVIPPPSFEILLRLTFPASSARVKATERFEAVYPSLKEVALTSAPGSKAMEPVIQQIFSLSSKLAGEGNPALAKEATAIAIWCVTENVDCCKHWDSLYTKNIEASVALLKKAVDEWKDHSLKLLSARNIFTLAETMKSFRLKLL
ncbi:PREDICTED: uncharacterized protein LOC104700524 isoform X2 [Camelina sativa]|uniref:Uncharacterized protein LOC104700524 isoform X2 n=1 Tax=Camelina sativa TaxID=90675 RepID=A0ABM0SPT5_CAMSA|nr:PREDICTED: uncharacterized protein LOC104700524 isoform X2 [Camelina sativa]